MSESPSNGTERPRSGPPEGHPSAEQLWNAIEFSHQFPELTLYLAADVKARTMAEKKQLKPLELHDEPLEFPPLIAPDPRELRAAHPAPVKQKKTRPSAELELFTRDRVPPLAPESSSQSPPDSSSERKKNSFWRNLLSFTILFALFC